MPSFRFCVLGSLSVSFHPTLFRSHSCLTGACLASVPLSVSFRFSIFPFFSAFFRPLLFRFRLLSLPFLLFPTSLIPLTVVPQVQLIRVPFRLFPYFRFRFGTQPSCISLLRFTVSHYRCYFSCRPPVSSSADPLSFRLRFWIMGRANAP